MATPASKVDLHSDTGKKIINPTGHPYQITWNQFVTTTVNIAVPVTTTITEVTLGTLLSNLAKQQPLFALTGTGNYCILLLGIELWGLVGGIVNVRVGAPFDLGNTSSTYFIFQIGGVVQMLVLTFNSVIANERTSILVDPEPRHQQIDQGTANSRPYVSWQFGVDDQQTIIIANTASTVSFMAYESLDPLGASTGSTTIYVRMKVKASATPTIAVAAMDLVINDPIMKGLLDDCRSRLSLDPTLTDSEVYGIMQKYNALAKYVKMLPVPSLNGASIQNEVPANTDRVLRSMTNPNKRPRAK